jgi:high-affinity nickel-transport protein
MSPLPADSFALVLLVFVLGVKHGFDADHLATIDGLTRYNARARPRMARFCGSLFSLGHGAVVVAIALAVSLLSGGWSAPEWLEFSGAWISIAFLVLLGVLNLRAVFAAEAHEVVRPVGLKGRWLGRLRGSRTRLASPWWGRCSPCPSTP